MYNKLCPDEIPQVRPVTQWRLKINTIVLLLRTDAGTRTTVACRP